MTRAIVFTLGFDTTAVITGLSEFGVRASDNVIFITFEPSSARSISAQKAAEVHIAALNSRGLGLSHQFIQVNDNQGSTMSEIHNALKCFDEIHFDISGGMRYVSIITYLCASLLGDRTKSISVKLESDGRRIYLPQLKMERPSSVEIKVLGELRGNPTNQRQLANVLNRRVSSISRTLDTLEKSGMIETSNSHPKVYSITKYGEIFLKDN